MRKLTAAVTALALCAALLAGCMNNTTSGNMGSGSGANSNSGVMSGTPATASPDNDPNRLGGANSSTGNGTDTDGFMNGDLFAGANAITGYSAEGLATVLNGLTGYGSDTAGGSLNSARAAGNLLRFAALAGTQSATLGADTQAWLDTLSEDQRAELRANWAAVREQARSIAGDPEGQAGILGNAGYNFDFTTLDMSGSEAFLNTIDSILGME